MGKVVRAFQTHFLVPFIYSASANRAKWTRFDSYLRRLLAASTTLSHLLNLKTFSQSLSDFLSSVSRAVTNSKSSPTTLKQL